MATIQALCPECGAPLRDSVVEIPGEPGRFGCAFCGLEWDETQVKRRSHLTVWSGVQEGDLNEAQTRALIEDYLKKADFSRWDHLFEYGTSSTLPFQGIRAINSASNKKRGEGFFLDTTTGANKVWRAGRGYNSIIPVDQGLIGFGGVWSPFYFSMRTNRGNPNATNAGERMQGIGWGDIPTVDTPWASNLASDPNCGATLQIRYNWTREKWEVLSFLTGYSPDYQVDDCTYQPTFSVDTHMAELAIDWSNGSFKFYINRVLAFTLGGQRAADLGNSGTDSGNAAYIFYANGSDASAFGSEVGFYQGHIWQPLALPGNNNQSYVP